MTGPPVAFRPGPGKSSNGSERHHRTHVDRAVFSRRAPHRPGDRVLETGHVDEIVAAELLLGLGELPVVALHLALLVEIDDRRRPRGPKCTMGDVGAGLVER